jgi:kynurenine formamidase
MPIVDLSHVIYPGMVTYPGLPGPEITPHLTFEESKKVYAPGTTFEINRISLVANTGTYVDSPAHRYAGTTDLSELALERLADLPGLVVRTPGPAVSASAFPADVRGRAVLVHTGWDKHFGTPAYGSPEHPYLTADAVELLVARGAALVGIDSVNIDDTRGGERPAHSGLLAAGIPVVEHLTGLDRLPDKGFRFHAVPPRFAGMGTFPVRAYAVLDR